ncbi:MAG: hypothetical protein HZA88_00530 [Verrucomicrobia bacterium]|nr:hypothetical protein [Verrucomicrobiota bacterium]
MWICSTIGFFSIVKKTGGFHVRARRRFDLETLLKESAVKAEIIETPVNDYRYRIIVPEKTLKQLWDILGKTITYDNFKSKIASIPTQRPKLFAYHEIWRAMRDIQA